LSLFFERRKGIFILGTFIIPKPYFLLFNISHLPSVFYFHYFYVTMWSCEKFK
jgi:hypothetical protein